MKVDEAVKSIRKYYLQQRRMPSSQELGDILGMTKKGAYNAAQKLVEAGILGRDEKGKLFPKKLFSIPDYGVIHAGYASPAHAIEGDSLDLYEFILDLPADVFSLKVKGDSMKNAMIGEGDIAIIDGSKPAKNGDIIAALVDGEVTLKYYFSDKKGVRLEPANPNFPTIYPEQELMVEGVVIHIIRKFM